MITTVTFDLDDTLYDEIDYCRSGFAAVGDHLAALPGTPSASRISDCLWRRFSAGNRTKTFNAALDELGIAYDEGLIRRLVQAYRNHRPNITLPQDSRDVLSGLQARYALGLLTDGFLPAQRLKVEALGLDIYFRSIVYTEQLGRKYWKPSPLGFEKVLGCLRAKPENAAYVADNEQKDFVAANKMGLATIQIVRPARLHTESADEPSAAPKHKIHKIGQLPTLLETL
jgi:putative hydrolase of the HAD superfamily